MTSGTRRDRMGGTDVRFRPVQAGSGRFGAGDLLVVTDHLGNDEPEELLGEHRIEAGFDSQLTEPCHLAVFPIGVGGGQASGRLVPTDVLSDLEPFRQEVDERCVDVVDAGSEALQLLVVRYRTHARARLPDRSTVDRFAATVTAMSLPRMFVDHPFPDLYRDLVDGRCEVVGSGTDDGLDTCDGILAGATRPWNAEAFTLAPTAKVISRVGVGYDNVTVADAAAAGIVVCNAPLAPMVSTAEHTMALLFAVTKHLPHHVDRARQGLKGEPVGRALELDGRTIGLIGLGRIASRVAVACQALGMSVIASDPAVAVSPVPGVELVDLPTLLERADVVSLHAPALPSTVRMIDARTLAMMRPGSYLINCARGVLVDHEALHDALDRGHLAGAGLDVTDPEPLPAGHPLLDRTDVVVTPHIASASVAGRRRLYEHSIENLLAVLDGRPASIVPPPTDLLD